MVGLICYLILCNLLIDVFGFGGFDWFSVVLFLLWWIFAVCGCCLLVVTFVFWFGVLCLTVWLVVFLLCEFGCWGVWF